MKIGACTNLDNAAKAAELGYDYLEIALNWLAGLSEDEWKEAERKANASPIPVLKANCMLPADVRVTGADADPEKQTAYLTKAFTRAKAIGINMVVFGSGGARGVPDGWDYEQAWLQIAAYLKLAGRLAEAYGIDVVIEPLRPQECNIVNMVSEALLLTALTGSDHVNVLGDTHHMLTAHEAWTALRHAGKRLHHIHISQSLPDYSGRVYPSEEAHSICDEVIPVLKAMNYEHDISIEASITDFATEAAFAVRYMRTLWDQTKLA